MCWRISTFCSQIFIQSVFHSSFIPVFRVFYLSHSSREPTVVSRAVINSRVGRDRTGLSWKVPVNSGWFWYSSVISAGLQPYCSITGMFVIQSALLEISLPCVIAIAALLCELLNCMLCLRPHSVCSSTKHFLSPAAKNEFCLLPAPHITSHHRLPCQAYLETCLLSSAQL